MNRSLKIMTCLGLILFYTSLSHAQKGAVHIEQDEKIETLLDLYKAVNSNTAHFRIQVGFGTFDQATEIKNNVEEDFPDLPAKIDFDSPTYRVRVGRFKDKLEAERKFMEVRKKYPNAMLLRPKKST